MVIFSLPARMIFVRIEPPTKHEMLAALVAVLLGSYGLLNHLSQIAIGLIATFVCGLNVLGISLDTL
jgi:hypothetical protein